MRSSRWHAPQFVLILVLAVAVIGTLIVGLLQGQQPQAATPAMTAAASSTGAGESGTQPGTEPAAAAAPTGSSILSDPMAMANADAMGTSGDMDTSGDMVNARTATESLDATGPTFVAPEYESARSTTLPKALADPAEVEAVINRAARTGQRTLLLQVRDEQGRAVNSILLATGVGGGPTFGLLLPPTLLVPVPAWTPLQQTVSAADTLQSRNGVSMLLGVRVDASLVLDRLALAALVDSMAGIPMKVDHAVTVTKDGAVVSEIPAGMAVLDGVSAADYAMTLPDGRPEQERLDRFADVVRRILRGLPESPEAMRQVVLSLGSLAKATATNDELVGLLQLLHEDAAAGLFEPITLPTTTVRGTGPVALDPVLAADLVYEVIPEAVLDPGESSGVRVVMRAAGASPGQVAQALALLEGQGMTVIDSGPSPVGQRDSAVLIQDSSPVARTMGGDVARALGLPQTVVRINGGARPTPDVLVLLGRSAALL